MNYHLPIKEIKNIVENITLFCALILVIFGVTADHSTLSSAGFEGTAVDNTLLYAGNMTDDSSSATSSFAYPDSYTSTGGNMTAVDNTLLYAGNMTDDSSSATSSFAYPDSYTSTGGNMTVATEDATAGGEPLLYDEAAINCFDYGGCGNATILEEANLLVQVDVLGGTAEASNFMIEVSSYTMDTSIPLDPNPFTFPGDEVGTSLTYTFYETPTSEINYDVNIIQQPNGDYSPEYDTGCTGTWKLGEYTTCIITISYEEPVSNPVEPEPVSSQEPVSNPVEPEPVSSQEPVSNPVEPEPVSSQEPVSNPVEPEPIENNKFSLPVNLATPIVGTSLTSLVTDTFPSVVIIAVVLLGGIGLGKYSKNLKRGRRVKIPLSAVVDITTKGGRSQ